MRALLLCLAVLALATVPVAAAEDDGGACIHQRGLTGFTVTISNCVPETSLQERVRDVLERPPS